MFNKQHIKAHPKHTTMIRRTISLDEATEQEIERQAQAQRRSFSQLVNLKLAKAFNVKVKIARKPKTKKVAA